LRALKVPMAQVAISTVTEGELRYGVARRPGATQLQTIVSEFLIRLAILPWIQKQRNSMGSFARRSNAKDGRWETSI
jgi:tRNA(fMet)-specific endonuclease VapC